MKAAWFYLRFMLAAATAYKIARIHNRQVAYVCITNHGVPDIAIFAATGREAWRVSMFAVENYPINKVEL